ncbi:MAG: primosomal protein N' [Bacteroidota bacterium]
MQTFFVDIVVPLPLNALYTYRVPVALNEEVAAGKRVLVQFGPKKVITGLIHSIHENPPTKYEAKYILSVIDDFPCVNAKQLKFWEWIANYYMCSIGEVMNAALPSGMKLSSETNIVLNPDIEIDYANLSNNEFLLVQVLEHKTKLTYKEAADILENKSVLPSIQGLLKKEIALLEEEIINSYKPKIINQVSLSPDFHNDFAIEALFERLKRAPKQIEILLAYFQLNKKENNFYGYVDRPLLSSMVESSSAALNSLIEKNIFIQQEFRQSRIKDFHTETPANKTLNEHQQTAIAEIKAKFEDNDVVLLHGITSSGKTEIYIKLIEEAISDGKQALYLLPEIALTSQIINRLRKVFGRNVGVYHSKFSDNERIEIYDSLINPNQTIAKPSVILGARSSIFMPFDNLGIIIVDEEHETSFKQFDPSPRYHARDAAIVLAKLHNTKILLGSATPSIETYYNAKYGKFALVELNKRFGDVELPKINIADLKDAYQSKKMKSHFSPVLVDAIGRALDKKEQVILFQNRRGFSPHLECNTCGWIPMCKYCNVTLTYHKKANALKCHYCGYATPVPVICPACNSTDIRFSGFGTEKIEEEIAIFFPDAKISRMDHDTTRKRNAYDRIISDFEQRKVDILVGTQMITKGLDFDNVSLVGVLNADNMLLFPDFRAHERSYQMMTQVSGRAGRKGKQGNVIIQTFTPNHPIIQHIIDSSYSQLFENEIVERQKFSYPPFTRLIKISLRHKEEHILDKASNELARLLRQKHSGYILGPEYPVVSRIKNLFVKEIMVKEVHAKNLAELKKEILAHSDNVKLQKDFKQVSISFNVDPL